MSRCFECPAELQYENILFLAGIPETRVLSNPRVQEMCPIL